MNRVEQQDRLKLNIQLIQDANLTAAEANTSSAIAFLELISEQLVDLQETASAISKSLG